MNRHGAESGASVDAGTKPTQLAVRTETAQETDTTAYTGFHPSRTTPLASARPGEAGLRLADTKLGTQQKSLINCMPKMQQKSERFSELRCQNSVLPVLLFLLPPASGGAVAEVLPVGHVGQAGGGAEDGQGRSRSNLGAQLGLGLVKGPVVVVVVGEVLAVEGAARAVDEATSAAAALAGAAQLPLPRPWRCRFLVGFLGFSAAPGSVAPKSFKGARSLRAAVSAAFLRLWPRTR